MKWLSLLADCTGAVAVFAAPIALLYIAYGYGLT